MIKNKLRKYFFLVLLNAFFFFIIIFLFLKIRDTMQQKNILGIQNITKLNKQNLIFDDQTNEFKYFYEPKPNNNDVWNPDWLEYKVVNHINSDSLNEENDYPVIKPQNTFRIITLGDSFTYGLYVETKNNYSKVLERLLNNNIKCLNIDRFEVINLGVGGYDIGYTVKRFEKRGLKYHPDLVIWLINPHNFYTYNDLAKPIEYDFKKKGIKDFYPMSEILPALERARRIIQRRYGDEYMFELSKKELFKVEALYKEKMLIVSIDRLISKYEEVILDLAKNTKYIYLPLNLDYWNHKDYQLLDTHPNNLGHGIIAREIFKYLQKNNFDGCLEV